MKQQKASKIVSGAILGLDSETALIDGKVYFIEAPTIAKIAGAGHYLANIGDCESLSDILSNMEHFENYAHALSWLIKGDDSLSETFINAPFEDVVSALSVAFTMISPENFIKLSVLAKSVLRLIAKPK